MKIKQIFSLITSSLLVFSMTSCSKENERVETYNANIYKQSDLTDIIETEGYLVLDGTKHSINTALADQSVIKVNVSNGQSVSVGDVLCELESSSLVAQKTSLEREWNIYREKYNGNISVYQSKVEQAKKSQEIQLESVNKSIGADQARKDKINANINDLNHQYDSTIAAANSCAASDDQAMQSQYSDYMIKAEQLQQSIDLLNTELSNIDSSIDQNQKQYDVVFSETEQAVNQAENELKIYEIENNKEADYQNQWNEINTKISQCIIASPYSGVVTDLNAVQGLCCSNGFLMNITEGESYCLKANVSESDYSKLSEGLVAEISYAADGNIHEIDGTVSSVSNIIGADRKFDVNVSFELPMNMKIAVGTEMKINIYTKNLKNVYSIKSTALMKDSDGSYYVFVAQKVGVGEYTAIKKSVKPGEVCGGNTVISESHMNMGDLIIDYPASIKPGDKVNINVTN